MKIAPLFFCTALALCAANATEVAPRIKLWPGQPPGSVSDGKYQEDVVYRDNDPAKPRMAKVTEPTLEIHLPAKDSANGTAVVVCPGGGYGFLAYDHEGIQVAKFLNEQGVAAFILKYRLPNDAIMNDRSVGPLQDVQEAIRTVRRRAGEWGVDAKHIGIMGFSAGGHLAASASTLYGDAVYKPSDETSARPDFSILVYPVISMRPEFTHTGSRDNLIGANASPEKVQHFSLDEQVNAETPPTFLIHSEDDQTVPVENSLRYFAALKKAKVPAELHVYPTGGHGYGLGVNAGSPSQWPEALKAWLKSRKLL
jgi:acetyl esterase/lipase